MSGKRRILIVSSFLDCTQVSSRKKRGKAGGIQEASKEQKFLMVYFCLEALRICSWEAALLPDFLWQAGYNGGKLPKKFPLPRRVAFNNVVKNSTIHHIWILGYQ
jgi:hypothetical protein